MIKKRIGIAALFTLVIALAGGYYWWSRPPVAQPLANDPNYRNINWPELLPKGWDPAQTIKKMDFSQMDDSDPRAWVALQAMRVSWDNAPAEPALNGAKVVMEGFMIPLDAEHEDVKELLLVPYFGACIHTPPPPANQIVHVILDKPAKDLRMMYHIKVRGVLSLQKSEADVGLGTNKSSYQMKAELISTQPNKS